MERVTIKIFGQTGQLLLEKEISNETEYIDFSDKPAGLYFIEIGKNNAGILHSKIIVQH